MDAIKSRFGIHYLQIREGDLWVADTVNASLGMRYIVPGGDKSPVFIRLPRVDSIQIMKNGRGACTAMRTCALTLASTFVKGQTKLCIHRGW